MSSAAATGRQEREAADWLARLSRPVVAQGDLSRFRSWREVPENDRAFQAVQEVMRRSGRLAADVDIRAALAQAEDRARKAPVSMTLVWGGAAGTAVALAAIALVTLAVYGDRAGERYATEVGERSVVHLADGSTVQLDTDSQLTASLEPRQRRLRLDRGQALFDVAHDGARPFIVTAGAVQVTATGTRFDVRRQADGNAKVVLLQGRVFVRSRQGLSRRSWTLQPGQELASVDRTAQVRAVHDETATAWTTGRLTFHDAAIADVLAEANRYSRLKLRLAADPRLERLRVDGVFAAGDTTGLARALGDLYDLKIQPQAAGDLLLRKD